MRKSQAAMEFIMTYGWAILVVLIAVGLLAYFGVLDFGGMEACVLPQGMDCIDKPSVLSNYIEIALKNNNAYRINVTDFGVTASKGIGAYQSAEINGQPLNSTGYTVENNGPIRIKAYFDSIEPGAQVRLDFVIRYLNTQTSINHDAIGYLTARKPK